MKPTPTAVSFPVRLQRPRGVFHGISIYPYMIMRFMFLFVYVC